MARSSQAHKLLASRHCTCPERARNFCGIWAPRPPLFAHQEGLCQGHGDSGSLCRARKSSSPLFSNRLAISSAFAMALSFFSIAEDSYHNYQTTLSPEALFKLCLSLTNTSSTFSSTAIRSTTPSNCIFPGCQNFSMQTTSRSRPWSCKLIALQQLLLHTPPLCPTWHQWHLSSSTLTPQPTWLANTLPFGQKTHPAKMKKT